MRLAIADPPYLGRAEIHYGAGAARRPAFGSGAARAAGGRQPSTHGTTEHPDAHLWDDPETHRGLVTRLCDEYDGWAVAMWRDSLPVYLSAAPVDARVGVWVKRRPVPGGSRIITAWEPVLFLVPPERRGRAGGVSVRDVLTTGPEDTNHVGSKPASWTRWVLDMLGYNPDADDLHDLFPGSGAVAAAAAQGVLA